MQAEASPGLRLPTPTLHRVCDGVTEAGLYAMVVFAPWAFGTTQEWSIWTMNGAGYFLGALLLVKWLVRWRTGYRPSRWGGTRGRGVARMLGAVTLALLGWCLVSALNARATYLPGQSRFDYHDASLPWLPHSYDAASTWFAFWRYLALAAFFWSLRDWLLGQTRAERHAQWAAAETREAGAQAAGEPADTGTGRADGRLPQRLRRLLWVLCLNGALLSLEGIIQRLDGTHKLLWLVQPRVNFHSIWQFGPYAYRSNAAQYLNLIWPVSLGFWWCLRAEARGTRSPFLRAGGSPHVLLLPAAALTLAGPIVSTSRAGAAVAVGGALAAFGLLAWLARGKWWMVLGLFLVLAAGLGLALDLGWQRLHTRFEENKSIGLGDRAEIYRNAREMAQEYGFLGSGPGTFGTLYQLYLRTPEDRWQWYAHNDWLETRVTFGLGGFILALGGLALVLGRWLVGGGILVPRGFVAFLWLSLGGCLMHATIDFPLQVYSVFLVVVLLAGVLSCVSREA